MFYLVSRFDDEVRTGASDLDSVPINGFQVVEVPDYVSIDESVSPFDQAELNSQKYQGILSARLDFDHVVYDDLLDDADVDKSASRAGGFWRGSVFLPPTDTNDGDGRFQSSAIDVSPDGSFSELAAHWDVYTVARTETDDRVEKFFTREDPDVLDCFLSNDGGSTWIPAMHEETVSFQTADNSLKIRFDNESSNRYYLGSYGILY